MSVELRTDSADTDSELDRLVSAGFGAVRAEVDWSDVEPREGQFDWNSLDNMVRGSSIRGIALMLAIRNAPAWSRVPSSRGLTNAPPREPSLLGTFVATVGKRYPGQISAWEFLPGENQVKFFPPRVDSGRMCELLRAAHDAAKSVDPTTLVITGAVSAQAASPADVPAASYVQELYSCGKGTFDAIGMNPTSAPLPLIDTLSGSGAGTQVNAVRQVMVINNDRDRRIIFTGFTVPTPPGGTSEAEQATDLVSGIDFLRRLDYAGAVVVTELTDRRTGSRDPLDNRGLVRSDGTAKPALRAVTSMRTN